MSLFASAFDSTAGAGPSFTPPSKTQSGQKKRKRPSAGGAGAEDKDGQLRSTQANLQKLMKGLDNQGAVDRAGGENMGSIKSKNKKNKQGKQKQRRGSDSGSGRPDTAPRVVDKDKVHKGGKHDGNPEEKSAAKSRPSASTGVEPAELPLPHTIKGHESAETEGLTKMQRDMKAKLEGARFRWINEQLYSTPSTDAVAMMQKDPKIFSDYHLTHRALTSAWPSPPLPHIISLLSPLPSGRVIADLGCGDAGLARALVPEGKVVLSYDLVGDRGNVGGGKGEGWVVEADFLSSVPLPGRTGGIGSGSGSSGKKGKGKKEASEVVDVVVCCLSLMGTNWIGGIYEACRILKQGGTFHIAEVTSRFVSTESFTDQVESFGFDLVSESSPSTHFTLFEFRKVADVPAGPVKGEKGWEKRLAEGGLILRPCVYKKR